MPLTGAAHMMAEEYVVEPDWDDGTKRVIVNRIAGVCNRAGWDKQKFADIVEKMGMINALKNTELEKLRS